MLRADFAENEYVVTDLWTTHYGTFKYKIVSCGFNSFETYCGLILVDEVEEYIPNDFWMQQRK